MDLNFKLTVEQTNVILEALGNGPYRTVAPIIAELQTQARPQMTPELVPNTGKAEGDA